MADVRALIISLGFSTGMTALIDVARLGKVKNCALLTFPSTHIKMEMYTAIKKNKPKKNTNEVLYMHDFLTTKKLQLF